MIADFTWPVVQNGWLECDGSDVNTTTYSGLYDVMTIQMTGTRTNGNATITSLSSTSNMRVGYYVFGTGISAGTTIASINSGTQITLSTNVSSSGTSSVIVSPWLLNTGTIRLPDLSTAGRFRRSRTSSTSVGQLQDSQNLAHTHAVTGTSSGQSASHNHPFSGATGSNNQNIDHTHNVGVSAGFATGTGAGIVTPGASITTSGGANSSLAHNHAFSGTTDGASGDHTHTINLTSASTGNSESRPVGIVLMTCVKI